VGFREFDSVLRRCPKLPLGILDTYVRRHLTGQRSAHHQRGSANAKSAADSTYFILPKSVRLQLNAKISIA
jgi:hypothetical protein